MQPEGSSPLYLVFVKTSDKEGDYQDALCWVLDSDAAVRTGVKVLGDRFGDDSFKPSFHMQGASDLDAESLHWVNLSLHEMANKVSEQLEPWVAWRNACKVIWPDRCLFKPDALHRLGQAAQREKSRRADEREFIERLLTADDLPRLDDDELAKLRAYLTAPLRLAAIQADPAENERRRKLKMILHYNENLRLFEKQKAAPATCADAHAIGNGGMAWQDAMKQAEEHVRAHDGACPSVKRLSEIVGCSRPTIDKAISKSAYLTARKAEAEKKKSGRTVALSDAAIEEVSERQHDELPDLIAEQQADMAREERQSQAARKRGS